MTDRGWRYLPGTALLVLGLVVQGDLRAVPLVAGVVLTSAATLAEILGLGERRR